MDEANQIGVQELDSKGLVNIVEEIKNGGPWITVKGLVATVTMNQSKFRCRKLELNKTLV